MPTRIKEVLRPRDWAEAIRILHRPGPSARPLALGPRPAALADLGAEAVVDLSRLGLAYVAQDDGEATLRLGGLTPLQQLVESPLVQSTADGIVAEAARLAAGLGLRHAASLAGALASPDGPPELRLTLQALEATAVVQGAARHETPLADWRPAEGEVLVEVRLDGSDWAHGSLQRVARTPRDQAIVAVAAALVLEADGTCRRAGVTLAGATRSGWPEPAGESESILRGRPITLERIQQAAAAASASADPVSDYRGSAGYRQAMAGSLTLRALTAAWQRASG